MRGERLSLMSRRILMLCGIVCVVVAVVTLPIPGVPSSGFLLVGVALLAKSSPGIERWLREHRLIGPWIERIEGLPRRKLIVVLVLWLIVLATTGWLASRWW